MGRRWVVRIAFVSFLVGLLLFGFLSYLVITAGGVNEGVLRLSCSRAVMGVEVPGYRSEESLRLERSYLPPSAVCRYSGGTTAALVAVTPLSWAGPALLAGSAVVALSIAANDVAVRRRRRSERTWK